MQLGIHLPQYGRVAGPDSISIAARHAEQLGFDDVWVSDHVVQPAGTKGLSPYLYDPVLTLAWAAANTQRVRLGTSVLVVPMREPVALANQLASLDALSKGRLVLGVGVGWCADEFDALGHDFASRGRRLDEALDMFHALWSDDPSSFTGRDRRFRDIRLLPKPCSEIPIWIGGNSEAAYRRAVRSGNGFQLNAASAEETKKAVERLRSERPEREFTISMRLDWDPLGVDASWLRDRVAAFADMGVQHLLVVLVRRELEEWRAAMERLASALLSEAASTLGRTRSSPDAGPWRAHPTESR
jgi:probable F420-dependent oxidoreductase